MKIAVLSDTHNLLRPEVIEIIKSSNAVIHGGDINSQGVLDEIKYISAFLSKNTGVKNPSTECSSS